MMRLTVAAEAMQAGVCGGFFFFATTGDKRERLKPSCRICA